MAIAATMGFLGLLYILLCITMFVLFVILFFKVWRMTNDVKKIKNIIALQNLGLPTEKKTITPADLVPVKSKEDIKVGDWCVIQEEMSRWYRVADLDEYKGYDGTFATLEEKAAVTGEFISSRKVSIYELLKLRNN